MESEEAILALAALAQGTRLDVFRRLVKHEPEGIAAGELARLLEVPQNTMSSHLAVLARAGLVAAERHSRSIIYRADLKAFQAVSAVPAAGLLRRKAGRLRAADREPDALLSASEEIHPCPRLICRAASLRRRWALRCWSPPWSAPASWPKA